MYSGICIFVVLAVLSANSFGQQTPEFSHGNPAAEELEQSLTEYHRHARAPLSASQRVNPQVLLARFIQQARKGSSERKPVFKKPKKMDPTQRITDRDYLGWMDFGRRSAEEYDYSS
ncbi:cholecystokinin [Tachyglossus aculeatus]|uniref:cholecystokinin n=1 Tax=Tachyglossus aculeatus TaxID=9261 RepID=UPI0018F7426E|nr:cholecystokinin [Tachyglossus aculeatus]XP_038628949.1 cholecystokinin [Tachyglossus aculeatus]